MTKILGPEGSDGIEVTSVKGEGTTFSFIIET